MKQKSRLRNNLIKLMNIYCPAVGDPESAVSTQAIGSHSLYSAMKKDPETNFTIDRYDRFVLYLGENWPDELDWPEGIERPELVDNQPSS